MLISLLKADGVGQDLRGDTTRVIVDMGADSEMYRLLLIMSAWLPVTIVLQLLMPIL